MKNSILFTLLLAGLALSGCNSSTRSSTAATDTTTSTPAPTVVDASSTTTSATSSTAVTQPQTTAPQEPAPSSTEPTSTYSATSTSSTATSPASSTSAYATTQPSTSTPTQIETPTQAEPPTQTTTPAPAEPQTQIATTTSTTTDVSTRITEWRLAPSDIQADLDSGTTIVRTKDSIAGEPTGASDDATIQSTVRTNLTSDSQLASALIDVEAKNGEVSLKGTANDAAQVGRAIAVALNSQGVSKVSSELKVSPSEPGATASLSSTTDTSRSVGASTTDSTFGQNTPATTSPDTTGAASATASTSPSSTAPGTSATYASTPGTVPPTPQEPGAPDATGATSTVGATSSSTSSTDATASTDPTRSTSQVAAATTGADITTRITEWRLSDSEIQADLDRGVAIVRTKDSIVGAPTGNTDDEVLKTMVQGKLGADSDTAKATIDVEATSGEVTLKGSADSASQIGRAIALALDTQGVTKVTSEVKVTTKSQNQN